MIRREDPIHALGLTKLHVAVLRFDATLAWEELIALTPRESIDDLDSMKRTPLSWAAQRGDVDQIRSLLIKGADPNARDIQGKSSLLYCANNTQCLSLLLQAGADPNQVDCLGHTKLNRLIHDTDDTSCAEILLTWGADLNLQRNNTPTIIVAVERCRPRTLKWLLDHDVELETRNSVGATALLSFLSVTEDDGPDMLGMLLEEAPIFSDGLFSRRIAPPYCSF